MNASSDFVLPPVGLDEPGCPYTGLRTFTEDEAIYFRGREPHVATCVRLLEAHHFVMITGASGDGKSSLVFAGLVPEIRAGFLRAPGAGWVVATFRPERQPLANLARAVAEGLGLLGSAEAVETELAQGFSALVQLYRASALCPAPPDPADPADPMAAAPRPATNLLLIADQFEEFFTNAENYADGVPTEQAQVVVNLLLETARLAREQQLPIYLICTMRSDYVGQCAEFAGLVELIGLSHYFVPRLLRHEFVEVIKEPALLSGCRISDRLVQRLLYDTRNGPDQLPVLQHALYQLWLAADHGRQELDLLHYAMIGGLPAAELPPESQAPFAAWQATLTDEQRHFLLASPSLHNVLDAHANQLFAQAPSAYNARFGPPLDAATARQVVEQVFRCLTRVDAQRIVRNRLSGAELAAIMQAPGVTWPVICRVLAPFRQPGNTFIYPFLSAAELAGTEVLPASTVLDITHESLIRNWSLLGRWALDEAQQVATGHDLLGQAQRWQRHAEDPGYLLPIGAYSYFAEWRARKQPSAAWLAYYVEQGPDPAARRPAAEAAMQGLGRYLAQSRRRLRVPLFIARHGLPRIVGTLLLLLAGALGVYFYVGYRQRQPDYVLYAVVQQRLPALRSPYVSLYEKANFVINLDRVKDQLYSPLLRPASPDYYAFPQVLDGLRSDSLALNIENEMFQNLEFINWYRVHDDPPLLRATLTDLDARLARSLAAANLGAAAPPSPALRSLATRVARYLITLTFYLNYRADPALAARREHYVEVLRQYARQEVRHATGRPPNRVSFFYTLRVLLAYGNYAPAELAFLRQLLPPVGGGAPTRFAYFFPSQPLGTFGTTQLNQAGGYYLGAIVALALHQPADFRRCLAATETKLSLNKATDFYDRNLLGLFPFVLKYRGFTPANTYPILAEVARKGGLPIYYCYSFLVHQLLSEKLDFRILPLDYWSTTGRNGRLNADIMSCLLPLADREAGWAALRAAQAPLARQAPLFIGYRAGTGPSSQQFLAAVYAKHRGIYEAVFRHNQARADSLFEAFYGIYQAHFAHDSAAVVRQSDWQVQRLAAGVALPEFISPRSFLLTVLRPTTAELSSFRTCSFDAFFQFLVAKAVASSPARRPLLAELAPQVGSDILSPNNAAYSYEATTPENYAVEEMPNGFPDTLWAGTLARQRALWPAAPGTAPHPPPYYAVLSYALQRLARPALLAATGWPALRTHVLAPLTPDDLRRGPHRFEYRVVLANLVEQLANTGRLAEAERLAQVLPPEQASAARLRICKALALHDDAAHAPYVRQVMSAYVRELRPTPERVALTALLLLGWHPAGQPPLSPDFSPAARQLVQRQEGDRREDGLLAFYAGRMLSGELTTGQTGLPDYLSETTRQHLYNQLLCGMAHRQLLAPRRWPPNAWQPYDEETLTLPYDYDGPNQYIIVD